MSAFAITSRLCLLNEFLADIYPHVLTHYNEETIKLHPPLKEKIQGGTSKPWEHDKEQKDAEAELVDRTKHEPNKECGGRFTLTRRSTGG